ncbi:MAG TPA: polysaccharide deacetylase family protein [Miltoncostaea sp.]|nr:polysaccharide deacetylase family protein [Miltoncostaea sp.]
MAGHRHRRRRSNRLLVVAAALVAIAVAAVAVGIARHGGDSATPPPDRPATTRSAAVTAPRRTEPAPPVFTPLAMPAAPVRDALVVPVLMFHRVASADTITNATSADLTVTPDRFAAEMAWLHRNGYHPVSQTTLFRALVDGGPLPRRPVVLTFDDGYVDDAVTVAPLLRRYGWPATFAIIAGRAGEAAFLTWDQIARLDREGFDIASHSMDHVELAGDGAADLHRQLDDSRHMIAAHVGHPVYWFVYPAGSYDATAEAAARDAGYLLAYTTDPGSSISSASPMAEPRVRVHGADTPAAFAATVGAASAG